MWNLFRKLFGFSVDKESAEQRDNVSEDIDSLLETLSSGDKETADHALESLARMAVDHESRIKILNKMIVHPSGLVRRRIHELLNYLADDPIEPLMEMYFAGDLDRTLRTRELFRLLSHFTAPFLFDRVRGQDETERRRAVQVLGDMGKDAVLHLLEALSDRSTHVRTGAALALARMGDEARMATPTLIEALRDENEDVRFLAAFALKRMGGVDYQDKANAVIEKLAEPLGALDTLEIYFADSPLKRARILVENPVTGEIIEDGRGGRFLTPEEDDRGGGMGAIRILGHSMVVYPGLGKVVEVSGVYDREIGLLAEEVRPVSNP